MPCVITASRLTDSRNKHLSPLPFSQVPHPTPHFSFSIAFFRTLKPTAVASVFGCYHPDTLASVACLGHLLHEQGKLDLDEPFVRRAQEGRSGLLDAIIPKRSRRSTT